MTPGSPDTDLREQYARALAEKFTSPYGARNKAWDIDGPDDDTNPYYLPVPMAERMKRDLMVVFTADDGHQAMRPATIPEVVATVLAVRDAELDRVRAELAEARQQRDRALGQLPRSIAEHFRESWRAPEQDQAWQPRPGDLVTGKARNEYDPDPVGRYVDTVRDTARIDITDAKRADYPNLMYSLAYVDADTLRPVPDANAEPDWGEGRTLQGDHRG